MSIKTVCFTGHYLAGKGWYLKKISMQNIFWTSRGQSFSTTDNLNERYWDQENNNWQQ